MSITTEAPRPTLSPGWNWTAEMPPKNWQYCLVGSSSNPKYKPVSLHYLEVSRQWHDSLRDKEYSSRTYDVWMPIPSPLAPADEPSPVKPIYSMETWPLGAWVRVKGSLDGPYLVTHISNNYLFGARRRDGDGCVLTWNKVNSDDCEVILQGFACPKESGKCGEDTW